MSAVLLEEPSNSAAPCFPPAIEEADADPAALIVVAAVLLALPFLSLSATTTQ